MAEGATLISSHFGRRRWVCQQDFCAAQGRALDVPARSANAAHTQHTRTERAKTRHSVQRAASLGQLL
jgi:hypothetical protein